MNRMRVLVVDDHTLFRKGLICLLEKDKEFQVVAEAENGTEGINKAKELRPDLVVMDIHMPGIGGIEATRRIRALLPSAKVVILTVSERDKDLFEAIKSGAHGYLAKSLEPEELRTMLRGVFNGEAPITRMTASKILTEFASQLAKKLKNPEDELSARERDVLQLLATGLTNKEIGRKLAMAENTVKTHLKNILNKLHLQNRVQAATYAHQRGFVSQNPSKDPPK